MKHAFVLFLLIAPALGQAEKIADYPQFRKAATSEKPIPVYKPVEKLTGTVRVVGSSTVSVAAHKWNERLRKLYPDLTVQLTGGGSSTAMKAMLDGKADVGATSRGLKVTEIEAFKEKFGYEPTTLLIAVDAIAIVVNRKNPIEGLTAKQLDAVFSAQRKRGGDRVETWGDLGVKGELKDKKLRLFGLNRSSGVYGWLQSFVLEGGEFRGSMREQPGSGAVVNAVGAYADGIGYASRVFVTKRTRVVPLAVKEGGPYFLPDKEHCYTGDYPLRRGLYLHVNRAPGKELPQALAEFLAYVCSTSGQHVVENTGFYPINGGIAKINLEAIGR